MEDDLFMVVVSSFAINMFVALLRNMGRMPLGMDRFCQKRILLATWRMHCRKPKCQVIICGHVLWVLCVFEMPASVCTSSTCLCQGWSSNIGTAG